MSDTEFSVLRESCGLTVAEAADFLGISEAQAKNVNSGRAKITPGMRKQFYKLFVKIERMALTGKTPRGSIKKAVMRRQMEMKIMRKARETDIGAE